ncbi:MAG: hypothetical protein AVDCRST_MAG54-3286, partial [uncultured Actinomycetospora sp.]
WSPRPAPRRTRWSGASPSGTPCAGASTRCGTG